MQEAWENPKGLYVPRQLETQVQSLIDTGSLPDQEYELDRFLVARDLYSEMKALQERADELLAQADGLSPKRQSLVDQTQQHFDWFILLDAVRFLEAALGE